ncbi:MAG: GTPase Era [Halobacteriovoraceae bacterium]|nr:GTPase Era [Halobacteriovoraceae bacterium]|tara:strand:- start:10688 stop:11656 length:969 start_codon:yes stop_codon:yes gene_type:complete
MLLTDQHPHNKHIMAALLGRPNAGKSTLINHLIGYDLSIVSHKPQTTRNQFQCAFTIDKTEIVLVDTPGIHSSTLELNIRMNGQAQFGADGVDLNLILIDLTESIEGQVKHFLKEFEGKLARSWVVFTKSDLVKNLNEAEIEEKFQQVKSLLVDAEKYFVVSAKNGDGVHLLTGDLCDAAEPGPHLYPDGAVSNKNQRFFASEYIREQAFHTLQDELPYELAVVIDEFFDAKTKGEKTENTKISASILVNRPSQRAIVVGKKGAVIKDIGTKARKKIEAMVGGKVYLNLHVKVSPKWFKNNFVLDEIGLPRTQKSHRVWRKK